MKYNKRDVQYLRELSEKYYNNEELTKEQRDLIHVGNYRLNMVKCLLCNDTIQSENRHDFKYCKCGNVSVDGGSWYLKEEYLYNFEEKLLYNLHLNL